MIALIWILIVILLIAKYLQKNYSRFEKYGVRYIKPVSLLGNVGPIVFRVRHMAEEYSRLRETFPEDRFLGKFELLRPILMVFDPELIKKVTVKDFEHFMDHRTFVDGTVDPMFGRNLFSLSGQEWKNMRSTLSPAFTSSKIRLMVPFMREVGELMVLSIKNKMAETNSNTIDVDCKDLATRYANDVIASCAFGLKVDSHTERNNEFYTKGKTASEFGFKRILVFLGYTSIPAICRFFRVKMFNDETKSFFKGLMNNMMMERQNQNTIRHDMIHILMELRKGNLKHDHKTTTEPDAGFATVEESDIGKKDIDIDWSFDDLVAQAMIFFVAGFETTSVGMTFTLYELAINPDIQQRLYEEIKENEKRNSGKFDFNSIQYMKYLDMVVSESLRLWPPAIGMDRLCVKDYNMGRPNRDAKDDFILHKGEGLVIPIWAIHRNPKHFPDPTTFDPERFNDRNRAKIKPFTFIPFGTGPRGCIGSRFALCELKVMVYQLLQHFEIAPCAKTRIPAKLATNSFNLNLEGGHWIKFKLRQHEN